MDDTIAIVKRFSQMGLPVRLQGIPSFIYELAQHLKGQQHVQLPPGSMLLTGGGWKAAEDKQVTREEFRRLVSETLGLPKEYARWLWHGGTWRPVYGM